MAKFEELLPALREGKKIRRKKRYYIIYLNKYSEDNFSLKDQNGFDIDIEIDEILSDDWEIVEEPKQKVKYYPVLVNCVNGPTFQNIKYRNDEEAKLYWKEKFIRLITEIPELIEIRDE